MQYYKSTNNKPFAFEDNVTAEIIAKVEATHNTTLTKITLAQYKALIAPTFAELQSKKLSEVKQAFNTALSTGYTCPTSNITMDATIDKIGILSSGYTLANAAGATTMDIRDYNNVVHKGVAIADVQIMLVELGGNYQVQLAKKWALEDKVKVTKTKTALNKIVW